MQKSSKLLLSLLVISGMVLTACGGADGVEEIIEDRIEGEVDLDFDEEDGKSGEEEEEENPNPDYEHTDEEMQMEEAPAEEAASVYKDGTYSTTGSYQSPAGAESMSISLTVSGDKITAVSVTPLATDDVSLKLQNQFSDAIGSEIVGMDLAELDGVSGVGGASLTSNGFNSALADLKAQAS